MEESNNRILAEEINEKMKKAVMPVTIFVGIEIPLGFFGNLAVLYVFCFRYHACNFRYFVLYLALTDILSTVTTMSGEMVTQFYWYVYPLPMLCKIKSFFNVFTVSSEALCLLTIAVDRERKVCHPHGWQIKESVAKWLWIGIFSLAFVVSLPVAILWGTHDERYPYDNNNVTVTVCARDQNYLNSKKPLTYTITLATLLSISLSIMFVLYVLIARQLLCVRRRKYNHAYRSPREDADGRPTQNGGAPSDAEASQDERRASDRTRRIARDARVRRKTLIMFILTLTFIITTIIYVVLLSLIADGVLPKMSDTRRAVYFFFFRLYFINHVINPIVYGILDPTFRETVLQCKRSVVGRTSST